MALALRVIGSKAKWYDQDWLAPGEATADIVSDFKTSDNKLSVYYIENEEELQRVAVAITRGRKNVQNFDYVLLEESDLVSLGIEVRNAEGATNDEVVNGWHRDLEKLTASKLLDLVRAYKTSSSVEGHLGRILEGKLKKLLS